MPADVMPKILYKYRHFNARSLEMALTEKVFLADPSTFNDPLDSKPHVIIDVTADELKSIHRKLLVERVIRDQKLAGQFISRTESDSVIDAILEKEEEEATLFSIRDDLTWHHRFRIQMEVLKRYEKGILSLAARDICPLMWSHYGDQHRGFCLGYEVPSRLRDAVRQVKYGGLRTIRASDINLMLDGDGDAEDAVDAASLLSKAEDWGYEREWRLIGPRGTLSYALKLREIVFGMRFPDVLVAAVIKAFQNRKTPIRFFRIRESQDNFELIKSAIDADFFLSVPPDGLEL